MKEGDYYDNQMYSKMWRSMSEKDRSNIAYPHGYNVFDCNRLCAHQLIEVNIK